MAMQKMTAMKIDNFKKMMGDRILTYNDLLPLIENDKNMPSWATLRKYNVIDIVKTESYTTELDDCGDALLWNGWYEWNPETKKWIIDHNFNLYGVV